LVFFGATDWLDAGAEAVLGRALTEGTDEAGAEVLSDDDSAVFVTVTGADDLESEEQAETSGIRIAAAPMTAAILGEGRDMLLLRMTNETNS
jgi:hypothetical protein